MGIVQRLMVSIAGLADGVSGVVSGVFRSVAAGYDAGRLSRKDAGYMPRALGPNAAAELAGGGGGMSLDMIRRRATDLLDNNELVDGACETTVDAIVGTGVDDIEPDTGWADVDTKIVELQEWAFEAVDPGRSMSMAALQAAYVRERFRTGECGVRIVMAPAFNGYPAMPAIELVQAERIPLTLSGVTKSGNRVRQGVEYDDLGRVVAYYVLARDPADVGGFTPDLVDAPALLGIAGLQVGSIEKIKGLDRVPTSQMRLAMSARRVGQLRGVPGMVSSMRTIRTEDTYCDTQMQMARTASGLGIIIPIEDAAMLPTPEKGQSLPIVFDNYGKPVSNLAPGSVSFTRSKTAPHVIHANLPGPMLEPTTKMLQRRQSRGLGVDYEALSGNYGDVTFASARVAKMDRRQRTLRQQEDWIVGPLLKPFRRALIEWSLVTNQLTLSADQWAEIARSPMAGSMRLYKAKYPLAPEPYVNPAQEATANRTDLESGISSEIEIIRQRGKSPRMVATERAKWIAMQLEEYTKAGIGPETARALVMASAAKGQVVVQDDSGEDEGGEGDEQRGDQQDEQQGADDDAAEGEAA